MKKYFLIGTVISIAIIATFSCRKSFDPAIDPSPMTNSSNETELKIQSFLDRMHSDLKDETTYSIEDAIWYAEATLNYSYAIYDSSFVYLSRKTSTFTIDLNPNNTVNQSELITTYLDMVDSLEAHYDCIIASQKHVFICDIMNEGTSAGKLNLSMNSIVAVYFTVVQYSSFDTTDYWFAGGGLGKCGDYYPSFIGRDATTELEYKLLRPLIASDPDIRIYYDDIETVFIDPYYYPYQNSPRGYRGYYFYSDNSQAGIQCLPPYEMNFYISSNGIPFIIDDNDNFVEKEFCDIDVTYDYMAGDRFWLEQHFFNIGYGVRNETEVPASEL